MLVALAGLLSGYNGHYEFKSGETYPADVNYHGMRLFLAVFGTLIVPLAYLTALNLGYSRRAAVLTAFMVLFDNALLTISRFILLDAILIFFTALSFFFLSAFHTERSSPFTVDWWFWLFCVGLGLGLVSSVKWVGFFTVALVGLYTIQDLYDKWGDLKMSMRTYAMHWIARILFLIVLPVVIYLLSFYLHFSVLRNSGPGDATMSSKFQANLNGIDLSDNPLELAYGSIVTLKNADYGGGLLHSHVQRYPSGSKQQQVTCYHHKDVNNNWVIHRTREAQTNYELSPVADPSVQYVMNGDVIRLLHNATEKNLHSHTIPAPVTKQHYEVSGYGNMDLGDDKDYWHVEVLSEDVEESKGRVQSLSTRFRLKHVVLGCYLRSHNKQLPEWGFKQAEVLCDRDNDNHPGTVWNIEWHRHEHMPPAPPSHFKTSFLMDVLHLNIAMWNTNNALVPDENKFDKLASQPYDWPFLLKGIRMNGWDANRSKIFMFGNPFIWWSAILSILAYLGVVLYYTVRRKRHHVDFSPQGWDHFLVVGKLVVGGWALHYLPFYIMGRVTYLHHYFPALYFSIFMVPFLLEHVLIRTGHVNDRVGRVVYVVVFMGVAGMFWFFRHVSYGIDFPSEQYANRQWLSTWTMATEQEVV